MQYIYSELRRLISELTVISELLHKNFFISIMKGQLICMTELLISTKDALLLSKVQKVIQKNRGNTNIHNRVIKVIISKTENRDNNSNNNDQVISNEYEYKYKTVSAEDKD